MVDPFFRPVGATATGVTTFDSGLRAHMQRVFNYMAGGLALTGAVAFLIANTPLAGMFFALSPNGGLHMTILGTIGMLAPLAFIIYFQMKIQSMSLGRMQSLFWIYCALMGLSMSLIFMVFSGTDVTRAFFITAADFGAVSLWGYTTKRDLTGMGAFMYMGLMGLFIACVVNFFMLSSALQWTISVAGVVIFTGLTAYKVQSIKEIYAASNGAEANAKMAVWGALSLYLSFINLFQFILSLSSSNRN
jgi:FtsH-binding integral membrane protein